MPPPRDPIAIGADVSLVRRATELGQAYRVGGQAGDPVRILADHGFNYARLRLFHTPCMRGPLVNSLAYTCASAREFKDAGYRFLLCMHYSDSWADPGQQTMPAAWAHLSYTGLVDAVYAYTRDAIHTLREAGAMPDMVQVGNEVTPGMLWEHGRLVQAHHIETAAWDPAEFAERAASSWGRFAGLLKAGIRGVHDGAAGEAVQIMIHIDRGGQRALSEEFFRGIVGQGVAFDAIGLSYYPFWHGPMADLADNLRHLPEAFDKDVYVVETAYPHRPHPAYIEARASRPDDIPWELSPAGQAAFVRDLAQLVFGQPDPRVRGLFYWAPECIAPPGERDFCGGATHARALFDRHGEALPALREFRRLSGRTPRPEGAPARPVVSRQTGSSVTVGCPSPARCNVPIL